MSNSPSTVPSLSIFDPSAFLNRNRFRYVVTLQRMENYDCEDRFPAGTPRTWKFKGGEQVVLGESDTEFTQDEISDMHRVFFVQWGAGVYKEAIPNNYLIYVPSDFNTLKPGELTSHEDYEDWKAGKQGW